MDIVLHSSNAYDVTVLPNSFIDSFMKDANGEYVKIYLYLLRCMGNPASSFSIEKVAKDLDHTQLDVKRALLYWESVGLLRLEYNDLEISSITLNDNSCHNFSENITPHSEPVAEIVSEDTESIVDLSTILNEEKYQELFYVAERLIGHTLSDSAIRTILFWYQDLNFTKDLIQYLIETCTEKQHPNIQYMNKVAINWANEGIHSVDQARLVSANYSDINHIVKSAFGISGRMLTNAENAYITRWTKFYGMPSDIIKEACDRTIIKTGKASFEYADGILKRWHDNKATSLDDVSILDEQHAKESVFSNVKKLPADNRFNDFNQRKYDYNEIQRKLSGL